MRPRCCSTLGSYLLVGGLELHRRTTLFEPLTAGGADRLLIAFEREIKGHEDAEYDDDDHIDFAMDLAKRIALGQLVALDFSFASICDSGAFPAIAARRRSPVKRTAGNDDPPRVAPFLAWRRTVPVAGARRRDPARSRLPQEVERPGPGADSIRSEGATVSRRRSFVGSVKAEATVAASVSLSRKPTTAVGASLLTFAFGLNQPLRDDGVGPQEHWRIVADSPGSMQ